MNPRYAHTIWCDDIRQEVGNKPSFMGVYTGGIVLPGLPTVLPRLSLWIVVSSPIENPIKNLSVRVERDDGTALLEVPDVDTSRVQSLPPDATKTVQAFMFGVTLSPVEVPAGCKHFQVIVTADGEELRGPKLWVEVNPAVLVQMGLQVPSPGVAEPLGSDEDEPTKR